LALVSGASASIACGDGVRILLGQDRPLVFADAAGDADAGSPFGAFGAPVLVSPLAATGADDVKPTLTADMLEIYFLSDRPGGPGHGDVWYATRAAATDAWGTPHCVLEVSSSSNETSPAVSADGLALWVASDRPGGTGGYDIWLSSRSGRGATWSTPTLVAELSSPNDDIPRPPGQHALVMPLGMGAIGSGKYQTFASSRTAIGASWTMPIRLSSVDTSGIDTDGFLTDDGLGLYFSSDRLIKGNQDLYFATRPATGADFVLFVALGELNSPAQDRDPWVSPDGHEIYFSSDRSGTLKIYHATR
jgi:hypothetical protein